MKYKNLHGSYMNNNLKNRENINGKIKESNTVTCAIKR